MRIIVSEFMSLDGVVQAPGHPDEDTDGGFSHGGWSAPYFDEEVMGASIGEVMGRCEGLLYGRRTWDVMAAAWPERAGDPFADEMNSYKKYVLSTTLSAGEVADRWTNSELLEDGLDGVRRLREDGNDAGLQVWGSSDLVRQLVANDLVDEYHLMIEPILVGGGKSIFPTDAQARPLELQSVTQAKTGTLVCIFRPAGPARAATRDHA
jgi:dihydrofolate reductase